MPTLRLPNPYLMWHSFLFSRVCWANRAGAVAHSSYYADPSAANDPTGGDIRNLSVKVGTDQVWRCSNYAFARAYSARGAKVYVGEFQSGALSTRTIRSPLP
ncbi:hypothetical protein DACRYDRAFT_108839 [Dacryopinax primogenitus]|uniref:Uncharacterized protein n=1 Tax=Dacryopinax primogenitus (strain DJM 731) TaxID=1858805 RepID=M5FT62_DACPD|nr:uncharacterized protein DACRYDRAFT_108839 [Dacryopinax primogenitus]EJU00781.1 hypothetical protein DACRYDRAFT_108839 [Dacryopinax primogenitus]